MPKGVYDRDIDAEQTRADRAVFVEVRGELVACNTCNRVYSIKRPYNLSTFLKHHCACGGSTFLITKKSRINPKLVHKHIKEVVNVKF